MSVHFGQLIARLKLAGGPSERESEFIICIFLHENGINHYHNHR